VSSDPQWAPDGTQPPELHTDPMLPAITDDMLPPLANPRVPTLDDRALAELLAELEGDDSPPADPLDDVDAPARNRSTADPLAAPRLAPESTGFDVDSLAAPRLAPDPARFAAEPTAAPRLAADPSDLGVPDPDNLAAQIELGAVPLPRPDPENSAAGGRPAQPPRTRMSGTTPGAGQPLRPRISQPLGARPGRAPGPRAGAPGSRAGAGGSRAGAPGSRAGAAGSRAGAGGSPLGHSGVGPVIRSEYGDFRPPVARVSDVPTGLTGLTRKSRSKVGSVLFTVVFIAIFVLILIQALASVFTASAGH
jgi:hypothetical protein